MFAFSSSIFSGSYTTSYIIYLPLPPAPVKGVLGERWDLSDADELLLVGGLQGLLLLLLEGRHPLPGEGVPEEEDQGHEAEEDCGDDGGEVVHDLQVFQGLDRALFVPVVHAQQRPVHAHGGQDLAQLSEEVTEKCIENLKEKYTAENSGIELVMITGGWDLVPKKEYWAVLKEQYGSKREGRLSRSALETLSIIAYSQPITRAEIEAIRGVGVDNMIRLLMERNLIKEVGKKEAPGRPTLFGTTKEFLRLFQLNSISELPKLDEDDQERFELAR